MTTEGHLYLARRGMSRPWRSVGVCILAAWVIFGLDVMTETHSSAWWFIAAGLGSYATIQWVVGAFGLRPRCDQCDYRPLLKLYMTSVYNSDHIEFLDAIEEQTGVDRATLLQIGHEIASEENDDDLHRWLREVEDNT